MSSLDNLRTRLTYQGGIAQEDRMDQDKLRSLKKALLYSYQAQTAILDDDREFKCLINHDKLKSHFHLKVGDFVRYKIPLPTGYKKTNALSVDIYKIKSRYNNLFIIQNINNPEDVKDDVAYGELKKITLLKPESSTFEEPAMKLIK